ncbi:hypothetical protein JHK82_045292 [Glycine max]|nr:hypothetical protein JHK82_045292 [Glycine max]
MGIGIGSKRMETEEWLKMQILKDMQQYLERKGTLLLSIMYEVADSVSPRFTDVFAAMTAAVNTEFPQVGNLLLRRIVLQLKRAYKPQLLAG